MRWRPTARSNFRCRSSASAFCVCRGFRRGRCGSTPSICRPTAYWNCGSRFPVIRSSGRIGQYAHGNEPSHHVAYLFRWSDRPEKTEEYVGRICRELYGAKPDGCCGNDDSGAMAAWYVFSALGFYPVDACGGEYVIGAPQVPGATLRLPNGKVFRMEAKGFGGEKRYVKSVTWNGRKIVNWRFRREELLAGGVLGFELE